MNQNPFHHNAEYEAGVTAQRLETLESNLIRVEKGMIDLQDCVKKTNGHINRLNILWASLAGAIALFRFFPPELLVRMFSG